MKKDTVKKEFIIALDNLKELFKLSWGEQYEDRLICPHCSRRYSSTEMDKKYCPYDRHRCELVSTLLDEDSQIYFQQFDTYLQYAAWMPEDLDSHLKKEDS